MRQNAQHLREALKFDSAHVEQMLVRGIWNNDTVAQWLSRHAQLTPHKLAIVWPGGTLTYAEAYERALRLARALGVLGLRKGHVVTI